MAEQAQNVMLAEKWMEDKDPTGYYISEKLDGVRAYWSGSTFFTRNGNVLNAPKWFKKGFPDIPLDGELWCGHNQFRKTVSIVRKKEPTEEWKYVKYYVFDAPGVKGPFERRMKFVQENVKKDVTPYAVPVGMKVCKGKEHMLGELKLVEKAGGEGLMLREPKSNYVFGRTTVLLKVKNFFDEEAIVIGHEKGSGRLAATMGALKVKTPDGREFSVGSGFTDKERNKPPKTGAVITYRYQEMTSKGNKPRFPVYIGTRIDLNWDDYCKSYVPPTLKPPPDLKLDNSILYSKEHGLEQYASFTDAAPSTAGGSAPAAAASSSSSSSKGEEDTPVQFASSSAAASSSSSSSSSSNDAPSKKRPAPAKEEAEESTGATDDKVPCKYGANCYQKSKEHLEKFSHPSKKPKLEAATESASAPSAVSSSAASSSVPPPAAPAPVAAPAPAPAPAAPNQGFSVPGAPASSTPVDAGRRRTLHYSGASASKQAQPQFQEVKEEEEEEEEEKEKEEACPYGDQCYRKNRLHFIEVAHPASHPMFAKGVFQGALITGAKKSAKPKKVEPEKEKEKEEETPSPSAEEKGKAKEKEEEEIVLELTETIVQPEKLNTSLAELTSSSEDESITWDANEGGAGITSESEAEKGKGNDPFDSDLDQTVVIERKEKKPVQEKMMEENDQTFVMAPRKKTDEDLNQTIVMTQKMASVYLIPALKANGLSKDQLSRYRLEEGKSMLGRGFGNLEIHDSRVSRCHLEANVTMATFPPTLSLILRGLNPSAIKKKGKEEFASMVPGEKEVVGEGDEVAFLPDFSHRFVVRIA